MRALRADTDSEPHGPASLDLGARIRAVLGDLSPAERRVAELISAEPGRIAQLTVTTLAEEAGTSSATVVRTAKSLGFDGYPQLRLALATQAGRTDAQPDGGLPRVADITDDDSVVTLLSKLAAFERDQIVATAELVSPVALEQTAARIAKARQCTVFGIGASGLVAQDLVQKITRIGLLGSAHTEHDAALVSASLLGPQDVAIAISHSGESAGALEPLRQARQAGAFTAAITGAARSSLAKAADQVLVTAGRELSLRSAAVGSRTSQLLVIDALFVRITQLTPSAARALKLTHDAIATARGRGR